MFAKTVPPAPVSARISGSHQLGTRLRLVPEIRDPGSVLIMGQVTGEYSNPCLICITHLPPDNGLSPIWRQAIIQTNARILSIGLLGTNFSEILIKIQNFSFTKMHLKISSAKWRPFCPRGDELSHRYILHQMDYIKHKLKAFYTRGPFNSKD